MERFKEERKLTPEEEEIRAEKLSCAKEILKASIKGNRQRREHFSLNMHENGSNQETYFSFTGLKSSVLEGKNAFLWSLEVIREYFPYKDEESRPKEHAVFDEIENFYRRNSNRIEDASVDAFDRILSEVTFSPTTGQSSSVAG